MKKRLFLLTAALVLMGLAACVPASSAVVGFVANPTTNSVDWTTFVTSTSAAINTNINFNTHPLGGLMGNFYQGSYGVTMTANGDSNAVQFGAGPGQPNTTTPPLSPGEGPHAASNYLLDGSSTSSLLISFNTPVSGVGMFIFDYFNPYGGERLTIEAFSGPNGTGLTLGSFSSVAYNFQPNHLYFMGVADNANTIGSLMFTDVDSGMSDRMGIDDIRFATVPEPSSLVALATGLTSIAGLAIRRRRAA